MDTAEGRAFADVLEATLFDKVLGAWYPRAVDLEFGGYLTDFNHRFESAGRQHKMIVTQARHLWTLSSVAHLYPETCQTFLPMAAHGLAQLVRHWDQSSGGFRELLTRSGAPIGNDIRTAYGTAFGIFGLAAYYQLSKSEKALNLAQEAFHWLEECSHDPEYEGYFQFVRPSGAPLQAGYGKFPPKDQNSSIHLLEAFVELHKVWPDSLVRLRVSELLRLIRDTMTKKGQYLRLFFSRDWRPVSYAQTRDYELDHVSFGHDVETAHLLLDADRMLAKPSVATKTTARSLVDHALAHGWDNERGGFYEQGFYRGEQCTIISDAKVWWAQFEGLLTLIQMSDLFPEQRAWYAERLGRLWTYIKSFLMDPTHGSCYWAGIDTRPEKAVMPKGEQWKSPYHTVRSLTGAISWITRRQFEDHTRDTST